MAGRSVVLYLKTMEIALETIFAWFASPRPFQVAPLTPEEFDKLRYA